MLRNTSILQHLKGAYHRIRPPQIHLLRLKIAAMAIPLLVLLFILAAIPAYYLTIPRFATDQANSIHLPQTYPTLIRKASNAKVSVTLFASVFDTDGIPSPSTPDKVMLGVLQNLAYLGENSGVAVDVILLRGTTSKKLNNRNAKTLKKLSRQGVHATSIPEADILARFPRSSQPNISRCLHGGVFVLIVDADIYVVYSKISPYMQSRNSSTKAIKSTASSPQGTHNVLNGMEMFLSLC